MKAGKKKPAFFQNFKSLVNNLNWKIYISFNLNNQSKTLLTPTNVLHKNKLLNINFYLYYINGVSYIFLLNLNLNDVIDNNKNLIDNDDYLSYKQNCLYI